MRCFLCAFEHFSRGVCHASRVKPQKNACQAIFYSANSESTPDNRDFCVTDGAKIHKYDRMLGIPEDAVASIMIYSEAVTGIVNRREGGDVFFSLPHFFALSDQTVRHGIVLKPPGHGAPQNNGDSPEPEAASRQVLLVSSVDREADISSREIYPMPKLFLTSGKFPFFTGISFAGSTMIVFIDPALLISRILPDTERESA
jgi:hypothetical protein